MQSTALFQLKITESLTLMVNTGYRSKMLILLIIDFKILGHVERRNSFKTTPFLKAPFFHTFKLQHAIIRR